MNERFNQTQPASTDGILAAEENIAFVFVCLPLRSLGDVPALAGAPPAQRHRWVQALPSC